MLGPLGAKVSHIGIDGRLTKLRHAVVHHTGAAPQRREVVLQVPASWGEIFKMKKGDAVREKPEEQNAAGENQS